MRRIHRHRRRRSLKFRRNAMRVHRKNFRARVMRGGFRL